MSVHSIWKCSLLRHLSSSYSASPNSHALKAPLVRMTNHLYFLDYCRSNVRRTVLAVVKFGFANFRIQLGPDEMVYASTASIRYAFSCRQLRVGPEYTVCKFSAYSVPLTVRDHLNTVYVRLKRKVKRCFFVKSLFVSAICLLKIIFSV